MRAPWVGDPLGIDQSIRESIGEPVGQPITDPVTEPITKPKAVRDADHDAVGERLPVPQSKLNPVPERKPHGGGYRHHDAEPDEIALTKSDANGCTPTLPSP